MDHRSQHAGGLVPRLAGHLNRKVSEILVLLFNHKCAGFVIAIIFIWKLLRPPQRNRPKQRTPPATGVEAISGSKTYASDIGLDE